MDSRQQSNADLSLRDRVTGFMAVAQPYHSKWWNKAQRFYGLYRNYRGLRDEYGKIGPNDKDEFWREQKRAWGADLFIPMAYTVVESTLPRMVAEDPRAQVLPVQQSAEANVDSARELLDLQMAQAKAAMLFQTTTKTALIYGTGFEKTYWRKDTRDKKILVPGKVRKNKLVVDNIVVTEFDDPDATDIDPADLFVDPMASSAQNAREIVHRTWRDGAYAREMIEGGLWRNIEIEDVQGAAAGTPDGLAESWNRRLEAAKMAGNDTDKRGRGMLEVWEYWSRDQVITVVNREWVVASGPNPHWHGRLPFHSYRPTEVPHELYGIGEIEPMEHLQEELNTLRTQRRDNATLVLQRTFAVWEGAVDPDDVIFAPGAVIPVQGDPRDLLFPIPVPEIPASGYQEEAAIMGDIERTTGISETAAGGSSEAASTSTATGAQLTVAAANIRTRNKTKRLEHEMIGAVGQDFLEMNQQRIRADRTVRMPKESAAGGSDQPQFAWKRFGPDNLRGLFEVRAEGAATEPDNIPLKQQTAQMLLNNFKDHPLIDQQRLLVRVLRDMGMNPPEAFLAPPSELDPQVMARALDVLGAADPELVAQTLQQAQESIAAEAQGGGQQASNEPEAGTPAEDAGEAVPA